MVILRKNISDTNCFGRWTVLMAEGYDKNGKRKMKRLSILY